MLFEYNRLEKTEINKKEYRAKRDITTLKLSFMLGNFGLNPANTKHECPFYTPN